MIVSKKIMAMCVLSTFFSCFIARAMDVINAKIVKLQNERSEVNKALVKMYGDSTMAYRVASKVALAENSYKLEKLKNEKVRLQSKV